MGAIRVLRVIARMNVGGPALHVAALTERLGPPRFESRLLVGSVGPGEVDWLELFAPGLPAHRVRGLGPSPHPFADAHAFRHLVAEIRRFRPHIVHTHTAKAGALGRLAARACGVPAVVHTFHGHVLHGYFSPVATRGVIAAERALARLSSRLVAVGEGVRDDLVAAGIGRPSQYVVFPPGIPLRPGPGRLAARRALGLPQAVPVVAFVGRLTRVKRPDRLVAVARLVAARHPDAVFVVAGEGDLAQRTRAEAADLGDRLRFLGWRRDPEVVHDAADLTLLTSDNEGMPVALIEAAAAGRPAVTTAVGSAPEVVADGVTGFVTPPTAAALADAVCRLIDGPDLRRRMGAAAAERARARFGLDRLVADLAGLYEELVVGGWRPANETEGP